MDIQNNQSSKAKPQNTFSHRSPASIQSGETALKGASFTEHSPTTTELSQQCLQAFSEAQSSSIEIYINQKPYSFFLPKETQFKCAEGENKRSIEDVLAAHFKGVTDGIAVAIKAEVIPRALWATTYVGDQDSLLVLTASQGG